MIDSTPREENKEGESRSSISAPTRVLANVDKVLPVANKEEFRERETKEDSLSTSIIEHVEVTLLSGPPMMEKIRQVSMIGSTPTEENKGEIRSSISDYPSFDKWLRWVRSDNEWVGEVLKKRQHWTYINVYAYFEKGEGYGGYGGYGVLYAKLLQPSSQKMENLFFIKHSWE